MAHTHYAQIDEQGRLILPSELVKAWGLAPGSRLRIQADGSGLHLQPPVSSLRRVYIELTNGCNMNCATCMRNVWEVETGCMAEATFERVLAGVQSFDPFPEIFFGGYGEPLSHPDCLEMVARSKSLDLQVSLITNGTLLSESAARRLIDLGLDRLWVSLDGASPECYTDVRLGNALPGILENLRTLHRLQVQRSGFSPWAFKPQLGIAFVAMQRNLADLPKVIRLGKSLGAVEFSISNVLAHDETLRRESLYLRSLDSSGGPASKRWQPLVQMPKMDITPFTAEVITELLKNDQRLSLFGSELSGGGDHCPFIERGSLAVRWDGKVSPCLPLLYTHSQYLDERLRTSNAYFVGDLSEGDLGEIWNATEYVALRNRLEDFDFSPCVSCNSCEMPDQNLEDCFGNVHPTCGGCLWAQGLIRCP